MIFDNSNFILPTSDRLLKRVTLFTFTILIWWFSEHHLRPLCGSLIQALRNQFGNGLLVQHIISQSLPVDVVCFTLFLVFYKSGIIPRPHLAGRWKIIIREGFLWGLLISLITIPVALQFGFHLGFAPDWQRTLGNVISNSYEEFNYRFFLFSVAAYTFRRVWLAVLISALLFAIIHNQYPGPLQIIVGLAGVFFSAAYLRSHSIISALLAHEMADAILDSILVR